MRMTRSIRVALMAVMAMTLIAVAPVAAVTDGELDGNGHPYVGLMVAQTATARRCGDAAARSSRRRSS